MSAFVNTDDGLVNLDQVERIYEGDNHNPSMVNLVGGRAVALAPYVSLDKQITQVIPAGDAWELLRRDSTDRNEFWVDPVIAWGVTIRGFLVPITAYSPSGEHDETVALRDVRTGHVYRDGEMHRSAAGWLE